MPEPALLPAIGFADYASRIGAFGRNFNDPQIPLTRRKNSTARDCVAIDVA